MGLSGDGRRAGYLETQAGSPRQRSELPADDARIERPCVVKLNQEFHRFCLDCLE